VIQYSNIQRFDNISFEDYLKLPGFSHSFLKRERNGVAEDLTITDNIRLGSMVDNILTEPHKVNMASHLYPAGRDIARMIVDKFGPLISKMKSQVSFTCDMEYNGFVMPSKARLDWLFDEVAVLDLKITKSKDLTSLIDFMGYRNQKWHYSKAAKVPRSYLLIHSVPLKKTEFIPIDVSATINPFWAEKIIKFGKVKQVA
jgi:hypothetical protein